MSLKVGDKVKLNPESEHAYNHPNNPLDTLGEVTKIGQSSEYPISVEWLNGYGNVYREHDLILQEEVKETMNTNKIGELITDWSELEVGDKAVFEGYKNDSCYDYTIGKTYEAVGSRAIIGFEDAEGCMKDTDQVGEYFNFRLVSRASFPNHPFKLRNGDKPEVRQWLKDNGVVWRDGDDVVKVIKSTSTDGSYLTVTKGKNLVTFMDESHFTDEDVQEIRLTIQPAKVLGYSLVEVPNKKSEKELQLEEIVAKLSSQLNEAQTELNKIK